MSLLLVFASGPGQQRLHPSLCFLPHAFEAPGDEGTAAFPAEALPVGYPAEALPVGLPWNLLPVTPPSEALPVTRPREA